MAGRVLNTLLDNSRTRTFKLQSLLSRNYGETMPIHKISIPGNKVKLRYFTQLV